MKIGIITFHSTRNYGGVLQAYALQTHLKKAGHDPFFINYIYRFEDLGQGLNRYLMKRWWLPQSLLYGTIIYFHLRLFSRFCKMHLNITSERYTDYRQLQRVPPLADAYICGSDQIWNPRLCRFETDEHVSWLDFGDEVVRRVAYAASFGVSNLNTNLRNKWSVYAKRFHAVSVREKDGVSLMKSLGRDDAIWVPDPTLLLHASEYGSIESQLTKHDKPYFFAYQIGPDNELASRVKSTVRAALGMPCRECYPNLPGHILLRGGGIGPDTWLASLHHSSFVITNSFHGLTLSLVFRRPFIILLHAQGASKLNTRVTSLLDAVGLQNRAVASFDRTQIECLCREEIDWDQVDDRLMRFRETGIRFINEALS